MLSSLSRQVHKLRKELDELRCQAGGANVSASNSPTAASHEFDKLSSTEQSAASLGVEPNAWSPIQFMNAAHYEQLISANMLDDDLARRIEAYRAVATASS